MRFSSELQGDSHIARETTSRVSRICRLFNSRGDCGTTSHNIQNRILENPFRRYVDMTLERHKVTYLYADILDFVLLTSNCTLDLLTTVN